MSDWGPRVVEGGIDDDAERVHVFTAPSSYALEKFYTAATNKHDHSESVHLRLPSNILAACSRLVARQVVPQWGTVPEFTRDAVFHRLVWAVQNMDLSAMPEVRQTVEMMAMQHQTDVMRLRREAADMLVEKWEAEVRFARSSGNERVVDEARRGLMLAVQQTEEPWRGKLGGLLQDLKQ